MSRRLLSLDDFLNQVLTRQGCEIVNQRRSLHQSRDIEPLWPWQPDRASFDIDDVASLNFHALLGMFIQRRARFALEHKEVGAPLRSGFENNRGAGDTRGHGLGLKLRASGVLRDAQQDRTAVKFSAPPGLIEGKNGIRTKSCNGQIFKRQFGAGLGASANPGSFAHGFIDHRGTRRGFAFQNAYLLNDARHPRFFFRTLLVRDGTVTNNEQCTSNRNQRG